MANFLDTLLTPTNEKDKTSTPLDFLSEGLLAGSNAMTANRSNKANIEATKLGLNQRQEEDFFRTLLAADQARNQNASGAFKHLLNTTYLGQPDAHVQTPGFAGKYSKPIAGVSEDQMKMANGPLRDELYNRATFGTDPLQGQMPTRRLDTSALDATGKSGFLEKLFGGLGTAAKIAGPFLAML